MRKLEQARCLFIAFTALVVAGCASQGDYTCENGCVALTNEASLADTYHQQESVSVVERIAEPRWFVRQGFFKENFERIAREMGIDHVIWDERTENCEWRQSTEFVVPRYTPHEALAFYAATQDFYLIFSSIDNSVRARYEGPRSRLSYCN